MMAGGSSGREGEEIDWRNLVKRFSVFSIVLKALL